MYFEEKSKNSKFFLRILFINDLPNATNFLTLLFADDTTFQVSGLDLSELFNIANTELEKSAVWFRANKLTLNVKKTKFMVFSETNTKIGNNSLKIGGTTIDQVGSNCKEKYFKFVGHVLDDRLSWEGHVEHVYAKKTGLCQFWHQLFLKISCLLIKEKYSIIVYLIPFKFWKSVVGLCKTKIIENKLGLSCAKLRKA